jgi:hypothetical protein
MAGTPELDQVAEARRRIAAHAQYPRSYWLVVGVALVFIEGLPVWMSYLPGADPAYLSWALAALALGLAVYSRLRRHRSGVYLPRRITAYPKAFRIWLTGLVVAIGGFVVLDQLVDHGHRDIALYVLGPVAAAVFVAQFATHSAMRADIEAGRVTS